ncbi:delta-class carbonic anhydrase [Vibrio sp. YMD68]|uniref:delta-class carbonic anhydrase n=1 Tax=Vibrio sp. YMD68 TaxID=3042300 RepID=UPI00249B4B9E|nr:delta-class carbonic anhydrase [Vibrio sp. YMD68]WGV98965.1 delta-class carbonic anhydrase [Vibrio sp. YMD68]
MKSAAVVIAVSSSLVNAQNGQYTSDDSVMNGVITEQRAMLSKNTQGKGFGPQSPRDLDQKEGRNQITFSAAPPATEMNLCNIHFHKNAEHKGGEFTQYAGNGDGQGYLSGYRYSGTLAPSERKPVKGEVCPSYPTGHTKNSQHSGYSGLSVGDTIEVHYVYSTAQVQPGATLGACFNDAIGNPQLRVETQVYVLVNDNNAGNFIELASVQEQNGKYQSVNIPSDTGTPIQYAGSTTGPNFNEKASPFQVTWSVRPKVAKVDINSVGRWCENNVFDEDHAHGVRNLVVNPDLLSPMN